MVKNLPAMQETLVRFLVGKIPWRSDSGYPLQYSWASLVAQTIKNHLQCGRSEFDPWVEKTPWRKVWQPTPVLLPGESSWTEKPGGLQFRESQRVRHELAATTHTHGKNHLEGSEGTIQSAHSGLGATPVLKG